MRHTTSLALGLLVTLGVASSAFAAGQPKGEQPGAKVTAPPEPEGAVKLFNGSDLKDWDGDMTLWAAEDGVIRGRTTKENPAKGNTFLIWKGGKVGDFDLRLSFRIPQPKDDRQRMWNSGVQYRCQRVAEKAQNAWVVAGYQAEVEDTPGKVGFLYDERGRGTLCNVGDVAVAEPAAAGEGKPVMKVTGKLGDRDEIGKAYKLGDWNEYVIVARGNHIKHYVNGVQTVDFTDNDEKNRELEGLLALQLHSGPPMVVEFKDIRLKHLGGDAGGAGNKK